MATTTETKIIEIRVQSTEALNRIDLLSKEIETLQNDLKTLNATYKEGTMHEDYYIKRKTVLTAAIKAHRQEVATLSREIVNNVKQSKEKLGYIQKLEAQVSNLTLKYKQLSEAELKGAKGKETLDVLTKKRAELQDLNQAYGNYTMNVGNYSSATKMMAINMSQVLREMPNFAISARIGIMSLTNNLPMLAENIKQVAAEQKILNQQFKAGLIDTKPEGTVKMLVKSMIGLNGIMAAAMLLIQVFGPQLIDWVGSLFKTKDATDKLTESQLGLKSSIEISRDAMKDGGEYKQAISNIEKLSVTLKAAKGNTDLEKAAVDEYNKTLGVTFGKVSDVDSALKKINENEKAYIEAMKNMSFANAFFAQSAEDATKVIEVNLKSNSEVVGAESQKYIDAINEQKEAIKQYKEIYAKGNYLGTKEEYQASLKQSEQYLQQLVTQYNNAAAKEREKQIAAIQKHQNKTLEEATKYYEKYAKAFKDNNWVVEQESAKSNKKITDNSKKEEDKRLANLRSYISNQLSIINENIARYEKELTPKEASLLDKVTKDATAVLNASITKNNAIVANDKEATEAQIANAERLKQAKMQSALDTANAGADILQGAFDFTNALAEAELATWAKQNKGKANYDEEYAKKKAELDHKAAVRNKAMQVVNSIINTAGAVVAALPNVPLSIAAGIAGAIQTAAIIATPIPDKDATSAGGGSSPSLPPDLTSKMASPLTNSVQTMGAMGGSNAITSGAANAAISPAFDYNAMAKVMSNLPAPELSIVELRTKERQVDFIDNISTLKS